MTERKNETQQHVSKLTFEDKVVAKIARIAVDDLDGILEMKGNLFDSVAGRFSNEQSTAGVDVEVGEKEAAVDLQIILEYGKSAVQLFERIKKVVQENIKAMTGLNVVEVNVNVVDVMTRKEYQRNKEDDSDK
ncbi:MAG: Asp23/Gls24 family envelope stress response protein [Tissierellia bacterium]|nr:Asp23/Gls24 family envelope stress response protein [Tissierellia bacterium]